MRRHLGCQRIFAAGDAAGVVAQIAPEHEVLRGKFFVERTVPQVFCSTKNIVGRRRAGARHRTASCLLHFGSSRSLHDCGSSSGFTNRVLMSTP